MTGREVTVLVDKQQDAGYYTVEFDGSKFASGVYFYRIQTDVFKAVKKMVLIK
jgi:uncharacterized protein (DUF427 family)